MFKHLYLKERLTILGAQIVTKICKAIIFILDYNLPVLDPIVEKLRKSKEK